MKVNRGISREYIMILRDGSLDRIERREQVEKSFRNRRQSRYPMIVLKAGGFLGAALFVGSVTVPEIAYEMRNLGAYSLMGSGFVWACLVVAYQIKNALHPRRIVSETVRAQKYLRDNGELPEGVLERKDLGLDRI